MTFDLFPRALEDHTPRFLDMLSPCCLIIGILESASTISWNCLVFHQKKNSFDWQSSVDPDFQVKNRAKEKLLDAF